MKRSRYSPCSASMICSSCVVPSVAVTSACVSPRVNSARAVGARQHAESDRDRAHGARVAAVDARLAVEDLAAHDLRFEIEQDVADFVRRPAGLTAGARVFAADASGRPRRSRRCASGCAPACCGSGTRRAGRLRRSAIMRSISASFFAAGCQSQSGLPRVAHEFVDRVDGGLHLLVAEAPRRRASLLRAAARLRIRPSAPHARCRRRRG